MAEFEKLFGKNVKKYRKAKGLSQERLAEMLGVTPEAVSKIETGKRFVTSDTLTKIVNALEIEPHELFLFENSKSTKVIYNNLLKILKTEKIKNDSKFLLLIYELIKEHINA